MSFIEFICVPGTNKFEWNMFWSNFSKGYSKLLDS